MKSFLKVTCRDLALGFAEKTTFAHGFGVVRTAFRAFFLNRPD